MNRLGSHIVAEFYGCSVDMLNNVTHIEESMLEAARQANATIINSTFHHFSPFGVSGVVVIQESHLAIHTWPEFGYAALDIFTCGASVNPWVCYKYLLSALQAEHGSAIEMGRGQLQLLEKAQNATHGEYVQTEVQPEYHRIVWFTERDEDIALSLRHQGEQLFNKQSPYQKVEMFDTFAYGKMLTLDGKVMTTERDEYVYHEMITHVPMLAHGSVKRVLVIGGGDGGAVRELLKHEGLQEVIMVEIDEAVIDACKLHLPSIACALDGKDARLKVLVEDGISYVNNTPDKAFDLVIVDSTDPIGPAKGLFTEEFYRNVKRILTDNGIMIAQSESPRFNVPVFQEIYACYRNIYGENNTFCYIINVPTYPSGTWSIAFCSKGEITPCNSYSLENAKDFCKKHELQYYNPEIHTACFALPNYVRKLLSNNNDN